MATLESLLVALIVLACALFSLWRLLSARLRLQLLDWLAAALGRPDRGWRGRLRRKALAELAGGCGACARAPRKLTEVSPHANRRPAAPRH
jgi:hypothetical protein